MLLNQPKKLPFFWYCKEVLQMYKSLDFVFCRKKVNKDKWIGVISAVYFRNFRLCGDVTMSRATLVVSSPRFLRSHHRVTSIQCPYTKSNGYWEPKSMGFLTQSCWNGFYIVIYRFLCFWFHIKMCPKYLFFLFTNWTLT